MIIVSAGMPRSASTLLFNLLRELMIFRHGFLHVYPVWKTLPSEEELLPEQIYIVKTHILERELITKADLIFYSFRDVRTAMVSNYRKFGEIPSFEWAKKYIYEWQKASEFATECFEYHTLADQTLKVAERLIKRFHMNLESGRLIQHYKLPLEEDSPDPDTMLHADHFTHTSNDDWREILDADLSKRINTQFAWWFQLCGYPME